MKYIETKTPWSDAPVLSTGNIYSYFADRLPDSLGDYIPSSITLYLDPDVDESMADQFLIGMTECLDSELRNRLRRRARIVELGLFNDDEIDSFLTKRRGVQPWVVYYSRFGGLGLAPKGKQGINEERGLVPCSTMKNHGTAWRRTPDGSLENWMVTARKEGQSWDWDSDIGHESAHAAFAPIPLFLQRTHSAASSDLSSVKDVSDLHAGHLARLSYMYTEISVITMRGEKRDTETGLPVAEQREELSAVLELSNKMMPSLGFDRALDACKRVNGLVDASHGDEIFEIGTAVMRVVPHINKMINGFAIPTVEWYTSIG